MIQIVTFPTRPTTSQAFKNSLAGGVRPGYSKKPLIKSTYDPSGLVAYPHEEQHQEMRKLVDQVMRSISEGTGGWLMDHHAGEAWNDFARGVRCGFNGALLDESAGSLSPMELRSEQRIAAWQIVNYLPGLRGRLDPMFEGLRSTIDPNGYYQRKFARLERAWACEMEMQDQYARNYSDPLEVRIHRCQKAAYDMTPEMVDFFDDLRNNIFSGGINAGWGWGDDQRSEENQFFGRW